MDLALLYPSNPQSNWFSLKPLISESVVMNFTKITQFLDWWKNQLLGIVPQKALFIFTKKTVFITYDGFQYSIFEPTHSIETQYKTGLPLKFEKEITNDNIATALQFFKKKLAKNNIVLLLTGNSFFTRQTQVPSQAFALGDQILQQDLKRLSPNEQSNLVADWYINKNDGKQTMVQLMVKKDHITQVTKQLGTLGLTLFKCRALLTDSKIAPTNFLKNWYSAPRSIFSLIKKLASYLLLATVFLAILFIWQNFDHQRKLINQLEIDVKNNKILANSVLDKVASANQRKDISNQLLTMKTLSESAVEIWEEMSKTFPDSVWLLQFNISGGKVKISGFAKSAAELIERIEASKQFSGAAFLSPVVAGIGNGLERFTITFRLSNPSLRIIGDQ